MINILNKNLFKSLLKPSIQWCTPVCSFNCNNKAVSIMKENKYELKTAFDQNNIKLNYTSFERNFEAAKTFPYLWLRTNCKCPSCYNSLTQEMELDIHQLQIDQSPQQIEIVNESAGQKNFELTCNYNWYNRFIFVF